MACRYLTEHRKSKGLTQAQAADLAGCGQRTWKRWEADQEAPGGAMDSIFEALGCTPGELSRPPKITGAAIPEVVRAVEKHGANEVVGAISHALGGKVALIRWTKGQV